MKKIALISLCFISFAQAEYRVYQYIVTNKIQSVLDAPLSSTQVSTLNPVSYIAYNGGNSLISVDLIRTWVCPGRTANFKELCQSPYAKLSDEVLK